MFLLNRGHLGLCGQERLSPKTHQTAKSSGEIPFFRLSLNRHLYLSPNKLGESKMGHQSRKGTRTEPTPADLDVWVRKYGGALRNYFRKRAPAALDPEDLVQEVFAKIARKADLTEVSTVESYLFRTANSVLIDSLRRSAARGGGSHETFEEERHGLADSDPERVLIGKEGVKRLISALYELPAPVRQAFALYHFEQFRHSEIAKHLRISVSTVEKYMARANAHLLTRLGRNDRY